MAVELNIVTGLLGSGKTCVVSHLLDASGLSDMAVVVGEFAEEGYDGAALKAPGREVSMIAGTAGRDPAEVYLPEVRALLMGRRCSRILLETSGVVEPQRLVAAVRDGGVPGIVLGKTVTVVDAGSYDRQKLRFAPQMRALVSLADVVVINKTDQVHASDLDRIREDVRRENDEAAVQFSYMGQVHRGTVLSALPEGRRPRLLDVTLEPDAAVDFEAMVYRTSRPCIDRVMFGHRLLNLPVQVARFKGVLRCWDRSHAVNGMPGQLDWDNVPVEGPTRIAIIGLGIASEAERIRALLDEELDRQDDDGR